MAFLDLSGLQRFKTKLESLFVKGPASATANRVATFDGTTGKTIKDSGYTIATSVPSGAVFTDTKVTSSANHYTPATASGSDKTASASGATAAWSIDVVKGVTLNTDGKGHVTGLSVTSGKIPANPNTDTKNTAGATDTSSKIFLVGATSQGANPQTYSHDTAYVGTDGCLYSGGEKVLTNSNIDIFIDSGFVTGFAQLKQGILSYVSRTTSEFLIYSKAVAEAPELIDSDGPTSLMLYISVYSRESTYSYTNFTCYVYPHLDYFDGQTLSRPFVLTYYKGQWTLQKMAFTSENSIVTAAAGSWSSATPPTQSITVSGVNTNTNLVVGIANTATVEEIDAATQAKIMCTAQTDNSITLTCYGEEPEINIPISVLIVG